MIREGKQENGKYTRYFRLGATEVDLCNRLRLQALLGFFQETAGDQCQEFGSGWADLWNKHGLCYVVVRLEVRMRRYPGTGETVRIDTWPENKLRLIFSRYGEIYDERGELLGAIASQWALLDVKARHFVRPTPEIVAMPDTSTLTAPFELSKGGNRFRAVDNAPHEPDANDSSAPDGEFRSFAFDRAPVYSDFDYNRHMNNARYAEWAADTLFRVLSDDERAMAPFISRLDIKFRAEIPADMAGRPLSIEGNVSDVSRSFAFAGIARCPGLPDTVHFECEGEYGV